MSPLLVILACVWPPVLAQNITGGILGSVTDPSGAAIANAEVEVSQVETNQTTRVRTDGTGAYQVHYLRPGTYRISVTGPGFKRSVRENLSLAVEARLRIDFQLEVGEATTSITVGAEAPLIESESASLGQVVNRRSVEELPIKGRNIFDLVGLSAGVQVNPRAMGSTASTGDIGAPLFVLSDISINGGRFRTNDYLVDGVSIMLPENNNFAISPSPDGTQEFKVLTNSFGPQFGRSGGGVVNVITKSGANDLHGSAYYFFRNDRLRANNFFSNARNQARPVFHFNMFGAAAGGPVIRNKTFFFADYQGHREDIAGGAGILTAPSDLEKRGDFSRTLNSQGNPVIVYNPFSTRMAAGGGFVRDPYAGNVIPAGNQSRVARRLLEFMPAANRPGQGPAQINNYAWNPASYVNSDQWSARLDHRFSEKNSLFGRAARNTGDTGQTGPFHSIADTVLGATISHALTGVANWTSTLSAQRILNVRVGAVRRFEGRIPRSSGNVNLTDLGFFPNIAAAVQEQIFPTISIANYTGLGAPAGDRIRRGNDIYTLVAEQTEYHGRHTLTWGADVRLYNQTPFQGGVPSGSYSFGLGQTQGPDPLRATLTAGNGLASVLTGFGGGSIDKVPAGAIRNLYYAFFFNDGIRMGRLTINAGLRWEYEQPRTERYNRFGTFDFDSRFPIPVPALPNLRGVLRLAGQDGQPRGNWDSTYTNFGPRLGLAYRLNTQTVLRTGYAIFFAPRFGTTGAQNFGMPGAQVSTPLVSSVDGVTPLNLFDNPFPTGLLEAPATEVYRTQLGLGLLAMNRGNQSNIYNQQWNVTAQRQLPGEWLLEAGYAANKGTRIPVSMDWNQIDPKFQSLGAGLNQPVTNPFFGIATTGTLAQRTVSQAQLLRPYPQYTSVNTNSPAVAQNMGSSSYHSFVLRTEKRFAKGYNLLITYTGSKLIDNGSGRVFGETAFVPPVQNAYNLAAERGLSEGDVSQRLVISHTVELPFGKGKALLSGAPRAVNWIVGGWSGTGAYTWNTGFPLALTSTGNSGVGSAVLRPNSTGKSAKLSGDPQTRLNRWFDISQFTVPEPFTFGNVSRTLADVRGPSRVNYDLAVQKSFLVREPVSLLFRTEVFNLTNTPYFFTPGEALGSPTFGVINSATGERQVQFSLKLLF
ncbi:MAG: carboxypeptidase regulatory-like domain-containing protein [Candidatus Solibacter usitatus]|nr:carboxypeptidase regulatory-like domain-containing protein [Candidatus Solibacter usitatus]